MSLNCATVLLGLAVLLHFSEASPREIVQSSKKISELDTVAIAANKVDLGSDNGEEDLKTVNLDSFNQLTSTINTLKALANYVTSATSSIIGNVTKGAQGEGIASLQDKPGSQITSLLLDKVITPFGGAECNIKDPWLLANIPGIYVGVPLVIIGVSILVGLVAAITVAIGSLGTDITNSIYEHMKNKGESGGYDSEADGSPDISRISSAVGSVGGNFSQAYDKYQESPYLASAHSWQLQQDVNNAHKLFHEMNLQNWKQKHANDLSKGNIHEKHV